MPIADRPYKKRPNGATWRSGYATVCKTVYTSSILVVASIFPSIIVVGDQGFAPVTVVVVPAGF